VKRSINATAPLGSAAPGFVTTQPEEISMRKFCMPALAAVSLFALPALAATGSANDPTSTTPKDTMQVQQQLRSDLSKAGYSDIKIVPGSFLVQAKDKQGNETEMMISPHSMTEVTAMSASDSTTQSGKSEGGKTGTASPTQTSK